VSCLDIIDCKPNTSYHLSGLIGKFYAFVVFGNDQVGNVIRDLPTDGVAQSVSDSRKMFIVFKKSDNTDFTQADINELNELPIMLTEGSTAPTQYIAAERTVLYTGESATDKNKRILHEDGLLECEDNEKHEVLDGNAGDWKYHTDMTGCKQIRMPMIHIDNAENIITKFNGKNLKEFTASGLTDGADQFAIDTSNYLIMNIADADSGFAEGFTEITPEMIAAILNGWVIYKYGTNLAYDGVDSFAFSKRYQGIGTKFDMPFGTSIETNTSLGENIIPTEKAYGSVTRCWSIWYDLAKPDIYTKQLPPLQLGSGVTHVTALTGRVKDLIKPVLNAAGTHYVVNHVLEGATLTEPCKRIVDIIKKKGDIEDTDLENWGVSSDQYAYGDQRQSILVSDYDKDAAYYFEYDTVAESTNSAVFSATLTHKDSLVDAVEKNGKTAVVHAEQIGMLARGVADLTRLKSYDPTLFNGWTSTVDVLVYINGRGEVTLEGVVTGGTVGSVIFTLASGFRPVKTERRSIISNSAFAYLVVDANGDVKLLQGSTASVDIGLKFDTKAGG